METSEIAAVCSFVIVQKVAKPELAETTTPKAADEKVTRMEPACNTK